MVQSGIHNLIYFLLAAFFSHNSFEVMALVEIALFIFPKSEKKGEGFFRAWRKVKESLRDQQKWEKALWNHSNKHVPFDFCCKELP